MKYNRISLLLLLLFLAIPSISYGASSTNPSAGATDSVEITTIGAKPTRLAVYAGPQSVPADGGTYYCVYVQLEDAYGNPAYAPAGGVGMSLSSSNTTVGTVSTTAAISTGWSYIRTYFKSTTTVGSTIITASAVGYSSGSMVITTDAAIGAPTQLAVYAAPPRLQANGKTYSYPVVVQLLDAAGKPAKATKNEGVSLLSTNPSVGTTTSASMIISTGTTYNVVGFRTTYLAGSTIIWASAAGYTSSSAAMKTIATAASNLAVTAAPNSLLADSGTHYCIFVHLQDAYGNPARAPASTVVSLSSTNVTVGTVPSAVTISTGQTFVRTWFAPSYTAGTTTINAVASGYVSASTTIRTIATVPTKLVLHPGPKLPADSGYHYTLAVQLQDNIGNPAKAPQGGVSVSLVSSNPTIGTVYSPVTISPGKTYAQIRFKSTYVPGSTAVNATAAGYSSASTTVTTMIPSGSPSKLAIYAAPAKLLAEKQTHSYPVIVQLQDATGKPARAPTGGVGIGLSSSNPSVGTVDTTVSIGMGDTYVRTRFYSTYVAGSASISAVSSKYASGSALMTTIGPTPHRMVILPAISEFLADAGSYSDVMVVQLQDAYGNPARAPSGGVGVSLWSSNPHVGTVQYYPTITISEGSTYSSAHFYSTYVPGKTCIIAAVAKLTSTLTLRLTPSTVSAGSLLTISGQLWPKITTTLYLFYRSGTPTWNLATTVSTDPNGHYSVTVTVPTIPTGTYQLVMVWMGSPTYNAAVSEIKILSVV